MITAATLLAPALVLATSADPDPPTGLTLNVYANAGRAGVAAGLAPPRSSIVSTAAMSVPASTGPFSAELVSRAQMRGRAPLSIAHSRSHHSPPRGFRASSQWLRIHLTI